MSKAFEKDIIIWAYPKEQFVKYESKSEKGKTLLGSKVHRNFENMECSPDSVNNIIKEIKSFNLRYSFQLQIPNGLKTK